jgi:hypothetical protein
MRKSEGGIFVTHHRLYPAQGQYFAVSCVHPRVYTGDFRSYACTVAVPPGCAIVGCRQLDLTSWKRLPFSTVFCDGEHLPGSPVVGAFRDGEAPSDRYFEPCIYNNLSSEIAYCYPWHLLTFWGLPFEENWSHPGLAPERLSAVFESEGKGILRLPQTLEELRQESLPLELLRAAPEAELSINKKGVMLHVSSVPGASVAEYPPLSASTSGVYLFKVKYQQPRPGDLVLKAVQTDGKDLPKQYCLTQVEGDCSVKFLEVKLKSGDTIQLQLVNQLSSDPAGSEFLIQEIGAYREKNPLRDVACENNEK